jgi:hypothetical protein
MRDHTLDNLVQEQTDLFNRNAPEEERIAVYQNIRDYQKKRKEGT